MPGKGRGRGAAGGQGRSWGGGGPGRSASSPGHLKQAAGAESSRDFAPGRSGVDRPSDAFEPEPRADGQRGGLAGLVDRLLGRR
jgi:hypothetical protein